VNYLLTIAKPSPKIILQFSASKKSLELTRPSMAETGENSILLLGYRSSSPSANGRRKKSKNRTSRGGFDDEDNRFQMHLSDTELSIKKREMEIERSTVFSDVLSDSLPSVRAHLAVSQMQSRSHLRRQLESSLNETKPLLASSLELQLGEEAATMTGNGFKETQSEPTELEQDTNVEKQTQKYQSISTGLIVKRRNRRDRLFNW